MALGKNKVLVIVLVVVAALVLCCGAAAAAFFIFIPDPLPDNIEIPDMVGMTIPEAREALSIRYRVVVVESDEQTGTVIAQSHAPGSKTHHDDIVTLEVAGPLVMPEIVGMTARDAQDALSELGFDAYAYQYDPSSSQPAGSVLTQEPAAGTECWDTATSFTIAGMDPYAGE